MSEDTISRKVAIDALFELYEYQRDIDPTEAADLVRQGIYLAEKKIEQLPSAQPELPEWAQKVEEYRKSAPSFVRNQLVWALYQTWKEYDGQLVHQRGKENRCLT